MIGSVRRDLQRMARLRAEGLSFGAALALGIGLGKPKIQYNSRSYNGKGLSGDQEAIAGDFFAAIKKKNGSKITGG